MRELIHWLHIVQPVSALRQFLQIPCQGGGVAADIDDALGGNFQHGLNADIVAALAGRVNADDVDLRVFPLCLQVFHVIREDLLGFSHVESSIFNAVPGGVLPGIFNGFGNDFDTVDLLCMAGHKEGDRSDAAVEVPDCFIAGQAGAVEGQAVELFRLAGIDLVEGKRGDSEGDGFLCLFKFCSGLRLLQLKFLQLILF